jgi:hypothetical protein
MLLSPRIWHTAQRWSYPDPAYPSIGRETRMPSEVRRLQFRSREIIVAITEYFHRRGMSLPGGTVARVVITEAETVHAVLDIATDLGDTVGVDINAEMLAASLILYCINRKIPLPADADKRLQRVQDDSVALVVVKHAKPSS